MKDIIAVTSYDNRQGPVEKWYEIDEQFSI